MGYKFFSDVKDEIKDNERLDAIRNIFQYDKDYSGPINTDNGKFESHGIIVNGYPHGLMIIKFKENKCTLHSFFHYGLPQGEWTLYDSNNRVIERKFMGIKELI